MFERIWLTNDGAQVRYFEQRIAEYADVKTGIAIKKSPLARDGNACPGMTGEIAFPR